MMKSTKNKKCFIFIIMFALSINIAFGAIVSDNDGSAFVTKSEFESLKENFKNQIDTYNNSINDKIDGAIAAYLAGIQLSKKIELDSLLNNINNNSDDGYYSGTTFRKFGYRCMAKRYNTPTTIKPRGAVVGAFLHMGHLGVDYSGNTFIGGWQRIGLNNTYRGNVGDVDIPSTGSRTGGIYLLMNKHVNGKYYLTNEYANVLYRYYVIGNSAQHDASYFPYSSSGGTWNWIIPEMRNTSKSWTIDSTYFKGQFSVSGSAELNLKAFYGATYEMTKTNFVMPVVGSISGQAYALRNDKIKEMTLQDQSYEWEWLAASGEYMYKKESGTWTSRTISKNNPNSTFYFNCHPYEQITLSDLIDNGATNQYAEGSVPIYGGLPVFKATDNGEVKMKITFKSSMNSPVYVGLSTSQFSNDALYTIDSSLSLRDENGAPYTSNEFNSNTEYTFVIDVKKDQFLWIKTYDKLSDTAFTGAVTNGIVLTTE